MTQLDDDEALILGQARRALGPTSADQQRVLLSLLPQLALSPGASITNPPSNSPWVLRAAGAVAVIGAVALSGGLGYRKGWQAGIAQQTKASARATVGVTAGVIASALPAPTTVPSAQSIDDARPASALAKPSPTLLPIPSAAHTRGELSAPAAAPGLDEEVRQLRRVERAIRENNPRFALVLLEELDLAIPLGQLLEERRAASIMANCQLGAGAADAHAFVAKHAGSAYLARVIEICGLDSERNPAAPGTHIPR